jgi:hypothetical protein
MKLKMVAAFISGAGFLILCSSIPPAVPVGSVVKTQLIDGSGYKGGDAWTDGGGSGSSVKVAEVARLKAQAAHILAGGRCLNKYDCNNLV